MKKEKIIKYGTMGSYLLLYIIVAVVSLFSSIHFFNLAHPGWMSIVLACSFELGQMACLFGALTRKKKGFDIVWVMFVVLTLFQCMANTYAAYIGLSDYNNWSELFGLTEMSQMEQKRIIAGISGAILPLVALGFIKCLTDFINGKNNDSVDTIYATVPFSEKQPEIEEKGPETETVEKEEEPVATPKPVEKAKRRNVEFAGREVSDEEAERIMKDKGISSYKKDLEESLGKLKESV